MALSEANGGAKCVICNNMTKEKVILFTEEKLAASLGVFELRVKHKLKYSDIILPKEIDMIHGYHSTCNKNFMAVNKRYLQLDEENADSSSSDPQSTNSELRSAETKIDEAAPSTSSAESPSDAMSITASNVSECCICEKKRKVQNYKVIPLHSTTDKKFIEDMLSNATVLNDIQMIAKLNGIMEKDIIYYHNICKTLYLKKSLNTPIVHHSEWHITRKAHETAFSEVCSFVESKIIQNHQSYIIDVLINIYSDILTRTFEKEYDSCTSNITPHHLIAKLEKQFNDKIQIIQFRKKKIVASREHCTINEETFSKLQESELLTKSALILRRKILEIKKTPLPSEIQVNNLISGECDIPTELFDFLKYLICGTDSRTLKGFKCCLKVESIGQDLIYAVNHGKIKTAKHIMLGMTLKSLTSSRRVIDILNKFGHCCSYNTVEELETEATFSTSNISKLCPDDIILAPNCCTGIAFDNFDRYVETVTGKDTLHDTVGIIYQNITSISDSYDCESNEVDHEIIDSPVIKRRRTFDAIAPELLSYNKNAKFVKTLLPNNSSLRNVDTLQFDKMKKLDVMWLLSHYYKVPDTPMWVGFNSRIVDDTSPKQKVSYLTPINSSPTNMSVVYLTMQQSQSIAEECKQRYMQVTYDLAIAKMAYRIQCTESPTFDNLFIHMGSFHVMLSYFRAIGKFIDGCGLTHIMVESGLLAAGSVNGVISGKHFNRCKRLHPMVALAFRMLHFNQFLDDTNMIIFPDDFVQILMANLNENFVSENEFLNQLVNKYLQYTELTSQGEHGKTAQYYITYCRLIEYYLMFTRSIRMGDFKLFKFIIPKLCSIFFTFNQTNYCRWLLLYLDKLLQVNESHPSLGDEFESGMFGIKRTDKPFSRIPIDLTLEQTINADASKRMTGIIHFTNSISARQRWAKSHGLRSRIISHVYNEIGLKKAQDITSELEKHQIKKDSLQLHRFMNKVNEYINPFKHKEIDTDYLFNISSGRSVSDVVAEFLLLCEKNGETARDNFINECAVSPERFEAPLKLNKILNFNENNITKKCIINSKVQEVRLQRDLFGRLLAISMTENPDIEQILKFPISAVPASLCHLDGTIMKTEKSALLKCFNIETVSTVRPDVVIIDGFYLLHTIKVVPQTFGKISQKILSIITNTTAQNIHIIFDRYLVTSIKSYERHRRNNINDSGYVIRGAEQSRPSDFNKELRNIKFKEALVVFLLDHWATSDAVEFIKGKKILLNYDVCYSYCIENGKVNRSIDEDFSCPAHEEADTKIVFHATNIVDKSDILIKCSDTDIIVIMLGNMSNISNDSKIFIEHGVSNKRQIININLLHQVLGPSLSNALPGFHALTGCDTNPAFFRKGKKRPFTILTKSLPFQKALQDLASDVCDRETVFPVLESYICHLYSVTGKSVQSVNLARYKLFLKMYKMKDVNEPFQTKKLRNFDASTLPPCSSEARQQFLRAQYISTVWKNANLKIPTTLDPEECGWIFGDGQYSFKWFEGPQLPFTVRDVILSDTNNEVNEENSDSEDDYDSEEDTENETSCESDID